MIPRLARVLAASLLAALLLSGTARAAEKDYFTADASQESILSEMAIHPASVQVGSVTYIAYQGRGFDPYVAGYDGATGRWTGPVRVGTNKLALDAHGAPAIWADASGRLHVMYGSHFTAMSCAIATDPRSISSWIDVPGPSGNGTYPQPVKLPGKLLLFYRQGGSDYFGWVFRVSHDGGSTWDDGYSTVLAGGTTGWYAHFDPGAGGIVHCAFTRYDAGATDTFLGRRNVYYIWRDPAGIWRNLAGSPVTMPVTQASADVECGVFWSGEHVVNEVVVKDDPAATATPSPLIQFLTGVGRGDGAYSWEFARRSSGTTWSLADITSTDHSFDAATFDPHADGSIDSYLVTGGSDSADSRVDPYEGRGGRIERWHSADHGRTWSFAERISPAEPGSLFSDPVLVDGAAAGPRLLFTSWTNDRSNFFHRLYLWGENGFARRSFTPTFTRVAGPDRVQTAVAVSRAAFPEGADCVLLATAYNYPDALAAAPLAEALHGPVLLTPSASLPDQVSAEIRRLGVRKVIILGSAKAVSSTVETQLKASAGVTTIERVAGGDRYATALAVARKLGTALGPLHRAIVVSGRNFPDALSAAPYAAWAGYPIILAAGDEAPTATLEALGDLDVTSTIVVGGPSAVSTGYASSLPTATRLAGPDRFATSGAVAHFALGAGLQPDRLVVANGMGFPDALAGAVLAARSRSPLLLVTKSGIPTATASLMSDVSTQTVRTWVLGSESAVDATTFGGIRGALTP